MNILLTPNAIAYTLGCLMQVAAPSLTYTTEDIDSSTPVVRLKGNLTLRFHRIAPTEYPSLLEGSYPMEQISSFDGAVSVPVLLKKENPFASWDGDCLTIHADVLTLSFLLLSRAEELLLPQRDQYSRFLWEYSLAKKYGFIDLPVVDEWAMLLRRFLLERLDETTLGKHHPSLRPTHDMDTARRFPSLFAAVRTILGGDLLCLKSPRIALTSIMQYIACRSHPEKDPELLGAEALLEISSKYSLCSEFYFMGLTEGEDDSRYNVFAPAVRAFAEKILGTGMICGFHPARQTPTNITRFCTEQERVAQALEIPADCGRQHYLCFSAADTPRIWAEAGIRYDSTLGYADHEGFRCGTCHAYPLYDLKEDRALPVLERPLIAMDGTLKGYRKLSCSEALDSLQNLFDRCYAVGGDFVILWHNRSVYRDWADWFHEVYAPFITWATKRLGKEVKYDQ